MPLCHKPNCQRSIWPHRLSGTWPGHILPPVPDGQELSGERHPAQLPAIVGNHELLKCQSLVNTRRQDFPQVWASNDLQSGERSARSKTALFAMPFRSWSYPLVTVDFSRTVIAASKRRVCGKGDLNGSLIRDKCPTALKSSHASSMQWRRRGSNPQPPACKAGALPIELRPRGRAFSGQLSALARQLSLADC